VNQAQAPRAIRRPQPAARPLDHPSRLVPCCAQGRSAGRPPARLSPDVNSCLGDRVAAATTRLAESTVWRSVRKTTERDGAADGKRRGACVVTVGRHVRVCPRRGARSGIRSAAGDTVRPPPDSRRPTENGTGSIHLAAGGIVTAGITCNSPPPDRGSHARRGVWLPWSLGRSLSFGAEVVDAGWPPPPLLSGAHPPQSDYRTGLLWISGTPWSPTVDWRHSRPMACHHDHGCLRRLTPGVLSMSAVAAGRPSTAPRRPPCGTI